jgi:carbamoyl-phosphate synthase large subunit
VASEGDTVGEAPRPGDEHLPTAPDLIAAGKVALVVNSPRGRGARADGAYIRRAANVHRIPCLTTAAAALAAAESTLDRSRHELRVRSLQEHHRRA